jgi:hypothetical protein
MKEVYSTEMASATYGIVFAIDGLIQVHWQNPANTDETQMISQGCFDDSEEMIAWARKQIDEKKSSCPSGWIPMLCDRTSQHFFLGKIKD